MKKLLSVLLALTMMVTLFGCSKSNGGNEGENTPATGDSVKYTYHTYSQSLGNKWNPHTWENSAENTILSYITTPLVSMSIDNSESGSYQWTFLGAESIEDVTAAHQDLITKYSTDGDGTETEGFVYEIKLNKELKWQDGTPINADTYLSSLKKLLDPDMLNYRAADSVNGDFMIAGAVDYFYSKTESFYQPLVSKYASVEDAEAASDTVYIDVYSFWGADDSYVDADGNSTPQYVSIHDETVYGESVGDAFSGAELVEDYPAYLADLSYYNILVQNENLGVDFDVVGVVKEDDYTLLWVNYYQTNRSYFLYSKTDSWLVYDALYEAGYDTTGELKTTDYGTSAETTMSYGPYIMESFEPDKQVVYVKNPNFYGFTETDEDGRIYGVTPFEVDGKKVEWYQTDKVVVDVMTDDAAKQAFLKGELDDWAPSADELPTYILSDNLYQVDETYGMELYFNADLNNLKAMDESKGNTNSVVLSNENFRKAFSLSIDRAEWVTATNGFKPLVGLITSLYYYDIWENPDSVYRNSDAAMAQICKMYGVEYGSGKAYATLKEAYDSISGYNLTQAKELMAQAFKEVTDAGLYNAGDPIYIRIGYAAGTLDSSQNQQITLLNKYINAAVEGSGFGTVTLEGVGNLTNRYQSTVDGEFAKDAGLLRSGSSFSDLLQRFLGSDNKDINTECPGYRCY